MHQCVYLSVRMLEEAEYEIEHMLTLVTALSNSSNQKFILHSCRGLQSFDEVMLIIGILRY